MYLGRIVAIGLTKEGNASAMYRVSSRSFPNREAIKTNQGIAIVPKAGFEGDLRKNPYIAYNCLRTAGKYVLTSNGSQTDPIIEKIAMGMPLRDAFAMGLLAMDYEKDQLDTPRIVAAIGNGDTTGYLGIVRKNALLVREFQLQPGQLFYISTYECNFPCDCFTDDKFSATNAAEACQYVINGGVFEDFTNPVTAACAVWKDGELDIATMDA